MDPAPAVHVVDVPSFPPVLPAQPTTDDAARFKSMAETLKKRDWLTEPLKEQLQACFPSAQDTDESGKRGLLLPF